MKKLKNIKNIKTKLVFTLGYLLCIAVLYKLGAPCVFETVLHIPCPGCGMTRAIISAMKLDFISAFHYHKMFWSVPILYLYFLFDGKLFTNKLINRTVFIFIAAGFIVFWIIKLCEIF